MLGTRSFLMEKRDEEEYLLVSEVYNDIVFKTQSLDYVDLLRESMRRFPDLAKEYNLEKDLDLAVRHSRRKSVKQAMVTSSLR